MKPFNYNDKRYYSYDDFILDNISSKSLDVILKLLRDGSGGFVKAVRYIRNANDGIGLYESKCIAEYILRNLLKVELLKKSNCEIAEITDDFI